MWPLAIGNNLRLSKQLYEIKLAQSLHSDLEENKQIVMNDLAFLNENTRLTNEERSVKMYQAYNVVYAFCVFRPDIKYVKHICYLVTAFNFYCDEYETFISVTNLIHQHYFMSMMRGNV